MAMTITGAIKSDISIVATHAFDLVTGTAPLRNTQTQDTNSTAATITCDLMWQDTNTIALGPGPAVDIVLDAGLTDYWGDAVVFDTIYAVYIRNTTVGASAGDSTMTIGLDALTPWPWFFTTEATDNIVISPGGFILASCGVDAGWPVGAGDILQIANDDAAHAMDYEIVIIGKE